MPKMKTRKAVKARFRVTGTGKLKRMRPGFSHLRGGKTAKNKHRLAKSQLVHEGQLKMYKIMMGV